MTRQECQQRLMALMDEAYAIAREYDPTINHVSIYKINNYTHLQGGKGQGIGDGYKFDEKLMAYRFADDEASA